MKSGYGHKRELISAQQPGHPLAHLARGFVGERNCEHTALGRRIAQAQVGDFVRDDTGFATTGARQHQQRCVPVLDGFFLGCVESGWQLSVARQKVADST